MTEWAFEPGAATGWHRHDFDYVIIPVIGGVVEIEDGAGKRTPFEMVAGVSYFRKAGVAHDVINGPGGELRFVRNDHPSMKMHDRHIVGRAALREMEELVGQSSDVHIPPRWGQVITTFPKCLHSVSVVARHRGEERAGAIGPAWHAGSGILGIGSESPRASMSDNCWYRTIRKGDPLMGPASWGSEGPSGVFAPEPEKDIRPSSPRDGRLAQ